MGKFLNAKNLTSMRSNSETMCRLFLRFQVSKVSLTKHRSNETKYGQKSSADLEIIGLEKLSNTFDKGILLNQQ
jgi:hypothetical protein